MAMGSEHVPAWKRIKIVQETAANEPASVEDPLNVTTHLATGTLTKKQKRAIIRGDDEEQQSRKRDKKKRAVKRAKLSKEDKLKSDRPPVLKDQLRYLLLFAQHCSEPIPAELQHWLPPTADDGVQEAWKFSKQKQNWLVRHFLNTTTIPPAHDPLLHRYFRDLQGGTRTQLAAKCHEAVRRWEDYQQRQQAAAAAAAAEKDGDDGPTKEEPEAGADTGTDSEPDPQAVERSRGLLRVWGESA